MNTYQPAVEIDHLRKTYGTLVAVDDVSVSVAEGEIFGILGPNGAGKTTAIECAIGLRQPDAERLCDRVALFDRGRLVALDAPDRLAAGARGGKTVRFVPSAPVDDRLLTGLPEVYGVERQGQHVLVTGTGDLVNAVILALAAAGVSARDVHLGASNLEDAFVALTSQDPSDGHRDNDREGAMA
jgi:ABC-type multidrug transport system ATPase subunit